MEIRLLWLNVEQTVFIETFDGGRTFNVAMRETSDHTWGPPIKLTPDAATARELDVN